MATIETPKTVQRARMSSSPLQRRKEMISQNRNIIQAKPNTKNVTERYDDARLYLKWLGTAEAQITPDVATSTGLQVALDRIIKEEFQKVYQFPGDIVKIAKDLQEKFESDNFGATAVVDDEPHSESDEEPLSSSTAVPLSEELVDPSASDPIFAEGGIMHGLVLKKKKNGGNKYVLNPEVHHKSCKVFGDNGLSLGAWFPFQMSALHHGAHGATTAGIAGDTVRGAYSIVVAGSYHDLDQDEGDTLYYSAPNSHDNTNPDAVTAPTTGSKALKASWANRNPVRVLRSGGSDKVKKHNHRLPEAGLRYDGLYRVAACNTKTNTRGGLYEQFRLERIEGQTPLGYIRRDYPTRSQVLDYSRMRERYSR